VSDKAHPENEGKVFLYKFGKKIFDKISAAMQPEFEDETPIDPFDFWQGANFKLKITKKDGYWNYDKSEFESPSVLGDFDDDVLEAIWKKANALTEFTNSESMKTYEQLDTRLKAVLGKPKTQKVDESFEDEEEFSAPPKKEPSFTIAKPAEDEDDDALSYFQRLAEE
jgi:hypothetical protein